MLIFLLVMYVDEIYKNVALKDLSRCEDESP